ncbi:MAG: DNA-binding protein [Rhodocyclales bacterium CG17_big_fil_post_rev_8_21_14_2_50_68_7]|nr:MAG: DNA-binding protein [Betaproteobacteria bacterium CG2_30_68_42]PIV75035.1 MAG: DNA-binding protein [Rhodocyclales bacterium CG17_big_fil_post_rev_8_21_14_2_50_68_7]
MLDVRAAREGMGAFADAWNSGKGRRSARIGFATPELLWKVLSAKRWELLKVLCGAGPVSMREAARRVERDGKAVRSDVTALQSVGLLNRTETGSIEFAYEAARVEFLLQAV